MSRFDSKGRDGVYLRTVHGDARVRELLRFLVDGDPGIVAEASPGRLTLGANSTAATFVLDGSGRAVVEIERGALTLDFHVLSKYDVVLEERPGIWRFVASGANRNYRIVVRNGAAKLEGSWDGLKGSAARLTVSGPATIVVDEFVMTAPKLPGELDVDAISDAAEREFTDWFALHGANATDDAAQLAAYVTWSALVPAGGMLRRESMLMSKNGMTHIWSWDHCFNAIALARDPASAADQLLTLFDHQDDAGALPDHVDDARIQPNFTKPPIHGWAIGYLMDRNGLSSRTLDAIFTPLARWTDWWFTRRVYGSDGVPSYNHGNDSGWDNSTVFAQGVPLQSPDLLAFLANTDADARTHCRSYRHRRWRRVAAAGEHDNQLVA